MTRQEKRAHLRSVAKDIGKMNSGRITVSEMKSMKTKIKRLQAAGVLAKRKNFFQMAFDSIRGLF